MARDLPEEIASSSLAPINRTAGQVTKGGTHWDFKPATEGEVFSLNPLPTRPFLQVEDLTGRTFGRLHVLGLAADKNGAWVVRCICGSYSHKKAKFLLKPDQSRHMCTRCDRVDQLRTYSGVWPDRSKESR